MLSRNDPLGFADRTRKNLKRIQTAYAANEDVHVVTQVGNSLLGLIVFPFERKIAGGVADLKLSELSELGWPTWEITLGKANTLGQLIKHLRNATAHGRITFSSDSRRLEEVYIEVEDFRMKATEPFWRARIKASDLLTFCLRFIDLIEHRPKS
jgi:hypothetical protein